MADKIIPVTSVALQAGSKVVFVSVRLLTTPCSSKVCAQVGASAATIGVKILSTQAILKDKMIEVFKLISSISSSTACQIRFLVKVKNSTKIKWFIQRL